MKWRLAIVDDHPLVREGIAEVFANEHDFEIVNQCGSADEAVRISSVDRPHLIFLDVNMPGGGVEAARRIQAAYPEIRTLMFSFRQDAELVRSCLAAGASGYVVKGISGPDLIAVARKVVQGEIFIDPKVQRAIERTADADQATAGMPAHAPGTDAPT
jgi:two-component system, NarL family, nitrate/nitrite response regulator NarL